MSELERRYKAKYTPLDRFKVQMWLAEMALQTARRMLKREEHQVCLDRWIAEMAALRSQMRNESVWTKWR